jgi:hypothetical protein
MRDDHSGTPAARTVPEAGEQAADEPRPGDTVAGTAEERPPRHPDPTRYGDWEKGGRCIDF